jgi:cell division protein FtsQ
LATSTTSPEAAPSRRRRARRALGTRAVAVAVAGAVVLAGGAAAAWSRLLDARTIAVTGTAHLSRAAVVRLAGVSPSTDLLSLDRDAVAARLEASPWIASATVERDLPFTLRISVVERTAVIAVPVDGAYRLVAGDGTSLGTTRRRPTLPLVAFRGRVDPTSAALAGAGAVAPMRPEVRRDVRRVVVGSDATLELLLRAGTRVAYGAPADAVAKARALDAVLAWLRREGTAASTIDVAAPAAPVVTRRRMLAPGA